MAIPEKPLVLRDFDPDELTLDEMCLFEADGFTVVGFRAFLIAHTDWSRAEIGALKVKELRDVAEQLGAQIKELAVPLAK